MKYQYNSLTLFNIFYLLSGILWILGFILILNKIKTEIHQTINTTWIQTITTDYKERFSLIDNKNIEKYRNSSDGSETIKIECDGKILELKYNLIPGSISQFDQETRIIQSLLQKIHPIDVYQIDSIFQEELSVNNIQATTAICYTIVNSSNKTLQHSHDDIRFYSNIYPTPIIYTGIDNSIELQGFVDYSWINYFKRMGLLSFVWITMGTFIVITYFFFLKKHQPGHIIRTISPDDTTDKNTTKVIHGGHSIIVTFHQRTRLIVSGQTSIMLTPMQGMLFQCLLENEHFFQDYDTLFEKLWGNKYSDKKNLEQQRYTLEEKLKVMPFIRIKTVPRMGYQLEKDEDVRIIVDTE